MIIKKQIFASFLKNQNALAKLLNKNIIMMPLILI